MGSSSSIANSVTWVEGALLGSAATIIAVLAVAAFGVAMFWGHVDWRRGARIVIGCFILFGAPVIAAGLLNASGSGGADSARTVAIQPTSHPLPYEPARQPKSVCWTCGVVQ